MSEDFKKYDYTAFDNKKLRILSLIRFHLKQIGLVGVAGLGLLLLGAVSWILISIGLLFIAFSVILFFVGLRGEAPGNVFARQNNLARPFMKNDSYYYFLYKEYKDAMESALTKTGAAAWGLPIGGGELGIAFFNNLDVLVWGRLSKNFPHLVIDATGNDRFLGNNIDRKELPLEELSLEGNFPEYFKVYMQKSQQILSLQILSPDRMVNLIDKMPRFDVEIKGGHIKIYGVNIQNNSQSVRAFMNVLQTLDEDLKIDRLNKIKVV